MPTGYYDAELEQRLRREVLQAWDAFAQASRESDDPGMFAYGGTAQAFEFDAFFRYQRAFKRFSDLVVYGKMPEMLD
jgi:hypothetical protein